jgi:membrane dipeptidase
MTTVTSAGVALFMDPFSAWASDDIDPRIAAIVANSFSIDTHNHIDVPSKPTELPDTKIDLLGNDEKFAKMMKPRLISKEQAKIVADAGSVIGVWTHLAATPLDYVQNIRAMVDVVGVDHVCVGTDTKMAKPYMSKNETNDAKKNERVGERTNLVWQNQTQGFYYLVVAEMLKAGFTETEITKIGGSNFCKVFDAATVGH